MGKLDWSLNDGTHLYLNPLGPNKDGKTDYEKNGWDIRDEPAFMQAGPQVGTDTMEGSKDVTLDLFLAFEGARGIPKLFEAAGSFFSRTALGADRAVVGTRIFRVWGRDYGAPDLLESQSGPFGRSWTSVDPTTVTNYRGVAGLPDELNLGRFVTEGILTDTTGVKVTTASEIGKNAGGLPEIVIPNPQVQIKITKVGGANPSF
jgi:hypothetical protein